MAKKKKRTVVSDEGVEYEEEHEEAHEDAQSYRVLDPNAIICSRDGDRASIIEEGEGGERTVSLTPSEAKNLTDHDVRLEAVETAE